jgi:SAM-dependent methyltransferase
MTLITRITNKIGRTLDSYRIREARTAKLAIQRISEDPSNPINWLDLLSIEFPSLSADSQALVEAHHLRRGGLVSQYRIEIQERANSFLRSAAARFDQDPVTSICEDVVMEFVRLKTIIQCRDAHAQGNYYADAEPYMQKQWDQVIWPIIKDLDFSNVLEIAPGHGRNTEKLRQVAKSIILVDVNPSCIEACRARFGEIHDGCRFTYYVTGGNSLQAIQSGSVTLVYTFDSMVHFDKAVVRDYVLEIFRVLSPGGSAFLHHSNYGTIAPNSDWAHNPGNRSDMTAELMRAYAQEAGLEIAFQRLSGMADGWGMDDLDAFTILRKPLTA